MRKAPATGFGPTARAFRAASLGACACTFGLLVIGGLVTSLEVGMSVPDATTTLGDPLVLAPQASLTPGQRVEHSHRLAGMVVGAVTLLLAAVGLAGAWRGALPRGAGLAAGLALCGVCVQGFLGMARVAANSVAWAMVHAALAQAVFALLVGVATVSLARWRTLAAEPGEPPPARWGALTCGLVFGQILLGIAMRHLGPLDAGLAGETHVLGAVVVTAAVGWLAMGALAVRPLRGLATALLVLLVLQLAVGAAAWAVAYVAPGAGTGTLAVAVATAHVALGAALCAATLATTLVAFRVRGVRASPAFVMGARIEALA